MANAVVSWLTETCPSWCVVTHREQDHPDDRVHEGAAIEVPAVLRRRRSAVQAANPQAEATVLLVVRHRRVGDGIDWLVVGTDAEYLDMSFETAARLEEVLRALFPD